jgi:exodeoxyribonuclease V gamma subunit
VPALRQRFGIAEDDLPQLQRWIRGANIRWGLHAEQRASLDLPQAGRRGGAEYLAVRPAADAARLRGRAEAAAWQGIEPYDEIGGIDAALLGPLVQLFERLDATWRALREPATVDDWCARLRRLARRLLRADDKRRRLHPAATRQRPAALARSL